MEKTQIHKISIAIIAIIMSVVILFCGQNCVLTYAEKAAQSSSEIVIERDSKRVLYENNASIKRAMASTTKIVTAICAIENSDVNAVVTIEKESVGIEGSSVYLREGERLTLKELLYCLMLRSGNDAADAIARFVGKSLDGFSDMMNELAKKVGAINSNFTNPHGLSEKEHYTTAYDLAVITAYALRNPIFYEFYEIVSCKRIEVSNEYYEYKRVLVNKNKLLFNLEGADGVKTGYTKEAGRCLVSSVTRNGMQLICVVLNLPPMFERSVELLERCFSKYCLKTVVNCGEILDHFSVYSNILEESREVAVGSISSITLPLTENEVKALSIKLKPNDNLCFPLKYADICGQIEFWVGNNLIFSQKAYIIENRIGYGFCDALSATLRNLTI